VEKLSILCLHGYAANARVMRRQMAPLAEGLESFVKLVSIDAPPLASGKLGWWRAIAIDDAAAADPGVGRGAKRYEGWPRSLEAIRSACVREGPFDGVLGFSQGAALAGLLVGSRPRGSRADREPQSLAFGFAVMVGGFISADSELARLYEERSNYEPPSMHIIGRSDNVVPREASLELASKFKDPLILEHDGGHVIPNAPPIRQEFRAFLEAMRHRKETCVAEPRCIEPAALQDGASGRDEREIWRRRSPPNRAHSALL
jgi:pimeloyl-ACP methyl ester carboxylesterase